MSAPPTPPRLLVRTSGARRFTGSPISSSAYPVQMLAEFASMKRVLYEDLRATPHEASLKWAVSARARVLLDVLRDAIVRGEREIDFRSPRDTTGADSSDRGEWEEALQTDATGRIFTAIDLVSRYGMKVRHNLEPEFEELQLRYHLAARLRQIEQLIRSYREPPYHTSNNDPVGYEWATRIVSELLRTVDDGGHVARLSQRARPHATVGAQSTAIRDRGMTRWYQYQVQRAIGLFEGYNFEIQWVSLPDEKFTWAPAPRVEFTGHSPGGPGPE